MSRPIRYCWLVEAADDPAKFAALHSSMYTNLRLGHYTVIGCDHDPPCRELTNAQWRDLMTRFEQPPSDNDRKMER